MIIIDEGLKNKVVVEVGQQFIGLYKCRLTCAVIGKSNLVKNMEFTSANCCDFGEISGRR